MRSFKHFIFEGRPSQSHPLEGHDYHRKTDAELNYIAKDAHEAAEAMKGHNTKAENKYRDQANDSATVRYWRQKHGMPNWYKKKYGHIREETLDEMDKSSPQPGRDGKVSHSTYGSRDKKGSDYFKGKESPGKAITVKQAAKDALDILKKQGVAEERNDTFDSKSHQYKTTMKHAVRPTVQQRMAAHDIKPGIAGYRDRIDLLKDLERTGKLKKKGVAEEVEIEEDWQKVNKSDRTDGLSQKAVDAYRRENPGSKLQTAVTEKNPKGKRAERRKSFCSRMSGMKRRLTNPENARDPDSPINKALRRWRC